MQHVVSFPDGNVSDVGDDGELSGNKDFAVPSEEAEEAQLANECENENDSSGDESNDDASGSKTTKKVKNKEKHFLERK